MPNPKESKLTQQYKKLLQQCRQAEERSPALVNTFVPVAIECSKEAYTAAQKEKDESKKLQLLFKAFIRIYNAGLVTKDKKLYEETLDKTIQIFWEIIEINPEKIIEFLNRNTQFSSLFFSTLANIEFIDFISRITKRCLVNLRALCQALLAANLLLPLQTVRAILATSSHYFFSRAIKTHIEEDACLALFEQTKQDIDALLQMLPNPFEADKEEKKQDDIFFIKIKISLYKSVLEQLDLASPAREGMKEAAQQFVESLETANFHNDDDLKKKAGKLISLINDPKAHQEQIPPAPIPTPTTSRSSSRNSNNLLPGPLNGTALEEFTRTLRTPRQTSRKRKRDAADSKLIIDLTEDPSSSDDVAAQTPPPQNMLAGTPELPHQAAATHKKRKIESDSSETEVSGSEEFLVLPQEKPQVQPERSVTPVDAPIEAQPQQNQILENNMHLEEDFTDDALFSILMTAADVSFNHLSDPDPNGETLPPISILPPLAMTNIIKKRAFSNAMLAYLSKGWGTEKDTCKVFREGTIQITNEEDKKSFYLYWRQWKYSVTIATPTASSMPTPLYRQPQAENSPWQQPATSSPTLFGLDQSPSSTPTRFPTLPSLESPVPAETTSTPLIQPKIEPDDPQSTSTPRCC